MKNSVPRRRLALLISDPGSDYSQSVITGVRDQCAKYDYDLLVFSTMVKVCHPDKVYLDGERNIFRMINYERVDGVLAASPRSPVSVRRGTESRRLAGTMTCRESKDTRFLTSSTGMPLMPVT